jgi:hypothetical protein
MAKRHKVRRVKPDEAFSFGPVTVSRYGKNVIWQADWPEGAHDEMQKRAIAMYPEVVKKIDGLVADIATLVSELPPEKLLHRAWWEFASRAVKLEAEADVGLDDAVALRMIDYIQSVIASVKPAENQRDDVTEDEWQSLKEKVDELFCEVNLNYQICRTAKAKAEDPHHDGDVEESRPRCTGAT